MRSGSVRRSSQEIIKINAGKANSCPPIEGVLGDYSHDWGYVDETPKKVHPCGTPRLLV
jgi:hypothetical protein